MQSSVADVDHLRPRLQRLEQQRVRAGHEALRVERIEGREQRRAAVRIEMRRDLVEQQESSVAQPRHSTAAVAEAL